MARLTGIVETALDVQDLGRAIAFYSGLLGLEIVERNERFCALSVADRDVLLLFQREAAPQAVDIPGGRIPPHGSSGSIHFAFSLEREEVDIWERFLTARGVAVESRVNWSRGGTSLYFRDPDGHLVELATPGVWSIY
ncbi:MAG TPA: VOC family protein [Terriglobia bacterium]|nr:VOC family protein [Terriglobia bacterium]